MEVGRFKPGSHRQHHIPVATLALAAGRFVPSPIDDLVRRAQEGEEAAFEALYRAHAGRVFALCLRLSGDRIRAGELVQDVFVHCWERLGTFRGESAFGSWLYRLAVNLVWMMQRSERRREARVLPVEDPEPLERPGDGPVPASGVDLERAIADLPDGAREVFVLYDIEGYRHEEIARMTGIAVGTSKAQLFRARRLLRERLER